MKKEHWEKVYENKGDNEVSWYEDLPETSLRLIEKYSNIEARTLDVGGGNSNLTKELFQSGFKNLTVLDISKAALKRSKEKLGQYSTLVNWVESDITDFTPNQMFDLWHDRAVFHFLTSKDERNSYLDTIIKSIPKGGIFILSTFSKKGPKKCSGLAIQQYDAASLLEIFGGSFEIIECFKEDHTTPFDTKQNFIYTVWRKK